MVNEDADLDANKCIRAILDEYYEVESLEDLKNERQNLESSLVHDAKSEFGLPESGVIQSHELTSIMNRFDGEKRQHMNNITPSSTRSNYSSNLDHQGVMSSFEQKNDDDADGAKLETFKDSNGDNIYGSGECSISKGIISPRGNRIESVDFGSSDFKQDAFKDHIKIGPSEPLQKQETIGEPKQPNANVKTKKPFLKKGSRKEPSSLQKADKDVLKKGMRFSNDIKADGCTTKKDTTSKDALEHLEQMQQEQLVNLEKRIERRNKARLEIKRKRMDDKKSTIRPHRESEEPRSDGRNNFGSDACQQEDSSTSSESDGDDDFSCQLDRESDCEDIGGHTREGKSATNIQAINSKVCKSHKVVNGNKNRTSPKQCKGSLNFNKNGRVDLKSPELKEQWQVIKSMRKRQEVALRTAQKEREEVSFEILVGNTI